MLNPHRIEPDQMRVAIKIASAQRGRLDISPGLLSLATIVKDQRHVPD